MSLASIIQSIDKITSGVLDYKLADEKLEASLDAIELSQDLKNQTIYNNQQYSEENWALKTQNALLMKDISTKLSKYNALGTTKSDLDAFFKTQTNNVYDSGNVDSLLENYNVDLQNGITFTVNGLQKNFDTGASIQKAIDTNQEIYSGLLEFDKTYEVLPYYYDTMKSDKGVPTVKDVLDFEHTVDDPANKNIFKKEIKIKDADGNDKLVYVDNHLARAFKTPKTSHSIHGQIGYVPSWSDVKSEAEARGVKKLQGGGYADPENNLDLQKLQMTADVNMLESRKNNFTPSKYSKIRTGIKELGYIDISQLSFSNAKDLGYDPYRIYSQNKDVFQKVGKNIDVLTRFVLSEDRFKTEFAKTADTVVNAAGPFSNVHSAPLEHWLGKQGEEGALVKKSEKGEWYVDQSLFDPSKGIDFSTGIFGGGESVTEQSDLVEHLLFAKEIQDNSILDPLDDGDGASESRYADLMQLDIAKQQGKLSNEEFKAAAQAVNFSSDSSPELDELMQLVLQQQPGDTLSVSGILDLAKLIKGN